MYLNDRQSFTETITGSSHDELREQHVTTFDDTHGEHGLMIKLGFANGATASISVAENAPDPLKAHDVLLEAATIGASTFIGMSFIDVLEHEFPDSDFVGEIDNNNAA